MTAKPSSRCRSRDGRVAGCAPLGATKMNPTPPIDFPDLYRSGTLEAGPIMLLSLVASGVLLGFSLPFLAILAALPGVAFLIRDMVHVLRNRSIRRKWAGSFGSLLPPRGALELLRGRPGRYRLHVRYYGGFDVARLTPCSVVENVETGECAAVHPASWGVVKFALESETEVVEHKAC